MGIMEIEICWNGQWLAAFQHQAIAWSNTASPSPGSIDTNLTITLFKIPNKWLNKKYILKIYKLN